MLHFVNTDRSNKVFIYFESSSIFISPCFSGLTGISAAVRPAASRQSDRRRKGSQTGGGDSKRQLIRRSDRSSNLGQTGGFQTVRPARLPRSDRDPSISRVTFISAKSFWFLGISTIHPPLVGLVLVIRSYKWYQSHVCSFRSLPILSFCHG